jgi:hypothetical protein
MMVNEMLRIDHLEKRIAESQAEIIKEMGRFEEEYDQYRSEVHESWAPNVHEVETKYDIIALRKEYKSTGKGAYKYSVAMFNAMSQFYGMKWHPRRKWRNRLGEESET